MGESLKEDLKAFLRDEKAKEIRKNLSPVIYTALGATAIPTSALASHLATSKMIRAQEYVSSPVKEKLIQKARELGSKVQIFPGVSPMAVWENPPLAPKAILPKGVTEHSMAHELAHTSKAGRIFGSLPIGISHTTMKLLPAVAAMVGMSAAAKALTDTDPNKASRVAKGVAVAGGALAIPKMYEEARATALALKYMKDAGMPIGSILKKGGPLALGQASYAALLLPALGLYFGAKALEK